MGHTFANQLLHVIFSTKERRATIENGFRDKLYAYMAGVAKGEFGWARKIGGTADHVHALV